MFHSLGERKDGALIHLHKREGDFAEAVEHLKREGVAVIPSNDNKTLTFTVSLQQLKEEAAAHEWLAQRLAPQHLISPKS